MKNLLLQVLGFAAGATIYDYFFSTEIDFVKNIVIAVIVGLGIFSYNGYNSKEKDTNA
jgi:hypothetical protein